jgi:hypothetical protein
MPIPIALGRVGEPGHLCVSEVFPGPQPRVGLRSLISEQSQNVDRVMKGTIYDVLDRLEPVPDEIEVPADASPLDFFRAVYRDARQPMPRRMKAAEAALPFVHPKLAVSVTLDNFAERMESMMERRGLSPVIDAKAKALGSGQRSNVVVIWTRAAWVAPASIGISLFVARLEDVRLYPATWHESETEAGCALATKWNGPLESVVVLDEPEDVDGIVPGFDAINYLLRPCSHANTERAYPFRPAKAVYGKLCPTFIFGLWMQLVSNDGEQSFDSRCAFPAILQFHDNGKLGQATSEGFGRESCAAYDDACSLTGNKCPKLYAADYTQDQSKSGNRFQLAYPTDWQSHPAKKLAYGAAQLLALGGLWLFFYGVLFTRIGNGIGLAAVFYLIIRWGLGV